MLYSVCTLSHSETVEVANAFDMSHPEFHRLELQNPARPGAAAENLWLRPKEVHANGMYMAAWRRS